MEDKLKKKRIRRIALAALAAICVIGGIFALNVERADYRVGVPCRGKYTLLLNEKCGSGEIYNAVKSECDGREYSIGFKLPAYGTAIIKFNMKK